MVTEEEFNHQHKLSLSLSLSGLQHLSQQLFFVSSIAILYVGHAYLVPCKPIEKPSGVCINNAMVSSSSSSTYG